MRVAHDIEPFAFPHESPRLATAQATQQKL
jgi:hypothetical protein